MIDISTTIAPKSDQLNADDLLAGPMTVRITHVMANPGSVEQPVNVNFEGDGGKPFRPCKSMRRVLVAAWGAAASDYVGRRMTLYRDPKVKYGGLEVGGIRISHMSDIERDMTLALTEARAKRVPYLVRRLTAPATPAEPAICAEARAIARRGVDAFRAWWALQLVNDRTALEPIIDELRVKATQADALAAAADPFGLAPLPDADAMARAEAAALAAIAAQDGEDAS
jgi:hypothetical protein